MWRHLLSVLAVVCIAAAAASRGTVRHFATTKFNLTRGEYRKTVEWCIENESVDVASWLRSGDTFTERDPTALSAAEAVQKRSLEILARCGYVG